MWKTELVDTRQLRESQRGLRLGIKNFTNFTNFIDEADPELQDANLTEERDLKHCTYREWSWDSQILIIFYNAFGAAILLLVPRGHRTKGGYSVSNKQ